MRWKPDPYQLRCARFVVNRACAGLFLDPGMRKTSITLASFSALLRKKLVTRALIIAPMRVAQSVWPREVAKWDEFNHLKLVVLRGSKRDELLASDHDIAVVNPELLPWFFEATEKLRRRGRWPYDFLVIDESLMFKHTRTKRFKLLKPHLHRFGRRVILTGEPAPNGLIDLFGQAYVLDQGRSLGRFITHYRSEFFDSTGFGGFTWVPKKGASRKIYHRLKDLVIRLDAKDYLKLPPLVTNNVWVDLPDEARAKYEQLEATFITTLNDRVVMAPSAGTLGMKLRQIANGGLYTSTAERGADREWAKLHDAKTEAVVELVAELNGKPALVAYEFEHDLARLRAAFPDAPHLGGGVTAKEQARIEDAWNAGVIPVLFAQPASVRWGLNLQGTAAAVIFHSLPWDLDHYKQLVRRVWRSGQKARVVVHRIAARETYDIAVLAALKRKDATQRDLLRAFRDYSRGVLRGLDRSVV